MDASAFARTRFLRLVVVTALALTGFGIAANTAAAEELKAPESPELLSVVKAGSGSGTVTSDPAGIDCGLDCEEWYEVNQKVTLTATPDPGSVFVGWDPGGGPGCPGTGTCSLSMATDKTVTAEFAKAYELSVAKTGTGSGTVLSNVPGIDCGWNCSKDYIEGTEVTLSATADPDSTFDGWSGAGCSGQETCVVTVDEAKQVEAVFSLTPDAYVLDLTKSGDGSGRVSSTPAGIDCGSDCSEEFGAGKEVTLVATPDSGSFFDGWFGGGCSGTDSCLVTMDQAKKVEASFTLDPGPQSLQLNVLKAGSGEGRVTASPGDIDCGPVCSEEFVQGTKVTLTATAENGDVFVEWQGPCEDGNPCLVTMDQSKTVTAVFEDPAPANHLVTVSKNGPGSGNVDSTPGGIACGEDCGEIYSDGTQLTLQATPDFASTFEGWNGGACSQIEGRICTVEVNGPKAADALFGNKPGGGAWARKRKPGLNTVPRQGSMNAVTGSCKLGDCRIEEVDARVVIKRRKYGSIDTSWSKDLFQAGQTRLVSVNFPERLRQMLETRKSGTLVVSIGLTAANGLRAVTREIKIGIRR